MLACHILGLFTTSLFFDLIIELSTDLSIHLSIGLSIDLLSTIIYLRMVVHVFR